MLPGPKAYMCYSCSSLERIECGAEFNITFEDATLCPRGAVCFWLEHPSSGIIDFLLFDIFLSGPQDFGYYSPTHSPALVPGTAYHVASVVCVQRASTNLATLVAAATVRFNQSSQFDAWCFDWKVNVGSCLENSRKMFPRNNPSITPYIFFLRG